MTADIDPEGSPTDAWFEWGESPALGFSTLLEYVDDGISRVEYQRLITGLFCGTTYYYRALAENASGQSDVGETVSFRTPGCGGNGTEQGFVAWAERQTCHGGQPAVLLHWSPLEGGSNLYTIERLDGAYSATVDTSESGFSHLITDGLNYDKGYTFEIVGENSDGLAVTSPVTAYVLDRICSVASGTSELPGEFILWNEPARCESGAPRVELPLVGFSWR